MKGRLKGKNRLLWKEGVLKPRKGIQGIEWSKDRKINANAIPQSFAEEIKHAQSPLCALKLTL